MFAQNREELRRFFQTCWQKRQANAPLQPLEQLVAQIVEQHPEYHAYLASDDQLDRDFTPEQGETNPWLHMGMHITLAEQLGTDRPTGIRHVYQQISACYDNRHDAEHAMMDCLGLILWEAQRAGSAPNDQNYLECLKKLIR